MTSYLLVESWGKPEYGYQSMNFLNHEESRGFFYLCGETLDFIIHYPFSFNP